MKPADVMISAVMIRQPGIPGGNEPILQQLKAAAGH